MLWIYSVNEFIVSLEWKSISVTGSSIPPPRYEHLSVVVDRKINRNSSSKESSSKECMLIFGGSGDQGLLNDVWSFDIGKSYFILYCVRNIFKHSTKIGSLKWEMLSTRGKFVPCARTLHSGCVVKGEDGKGDRLYIFGGGAMGDSPVQDSSVYCLDIGID